MYTFLQVGSRRKVNNIASNAGYQLRIDTSNASTAFSIAYFVGYFDANQAGPSSAVAQLITCVNDLCLESSSVNWQPAPI
jgi:hypothetical protein